MATQADHIEYEGKISSFRAMTRDDVKLHMDLYHRKIAYAAQLRRRLANPKSQKFALNPRAWWYAREAAKAIVQSAAAEVAAAKAMLKSQEIVDGMFTAKQPTGGAGMDLDA